MNSFEKRERTAEEWYVLGLEEKDLEKQVEYYTKALEIDPHFESARTDKEIAEGKLKEEREMEKEAGVMWKMPFIPKKSRIRGLLKKEDPLIALKKFSRDRDLIPILIELLYDANQNVRKGAADNIGAIGAHNPDLVKNALPRLIKLLDDSNMTVRIKAADTIWLLVEF